VQDAKIYENPTEQGFYRGIILHKDRGDRFCVQKIADKSLAIHDRRQFEKLPEKGERAQVNVVRKSIET
jgi:hypothetical protein